MDRELLFSEKWATRKKHDIFFSSFLFIFLDIFSNNPILFIYAVKIITLEFYIMCHYSQAMVKSPDPVNWTVPLDTGKTFTVTHSMPDGEKMLY